MTNAEAQWYAMLAFLNLGFSKEDAWRLDSEMHRMMDLYTPQEAEAMVLRHKVP